MKSRDLVFPALVFLGGAMIGRMFGVMPVMRGMMSAASLTSLVPDAPKKPRRARSHAARKRPIQKKSSPA